MSDTNITPNTPPTEPASISSMISDNSGGTSSMRVFMLVGGGFILAVWGFIAIWCVLHGMPIPDIPLQWSLAFTSLIAGKVGQKYFEVKS